MGHMKVAVSCMWEETRAPPPRLAMSVGKDYGK